MTEIVQAPQPGQFVAVNPDGSLAPVAMETSLSFGAVFVVSGKKVPIRSGELLPDPQTSQSSGISFSLPEGYVLDLGTLQQLITWAAETMGFTAPNFDSLPQALRNILEAGVKITELSVKASTAEVEFALEVLTTFNWEVISGIKLESFTFRVAREGEPAAPPLEALPAAA